MTKEEIYQLATLAKVSLHEKEAEQLTIELRDMLNSMVLPKVEIDLCMEDSMQLRADDVSIADDVIESGEIFWVPKML